MLHTICFLVHNNSFLYKYYFCEKQVHQAAPFCKKVIIEQAECIHALSPVLHITLFILYYFRMSYYIIVHASMLQLLGDASENFQGNYYN